MHLRHARSGIYLHGALKAYRTYALIRSEFRYERARQFGYSNYSFDCFYKEGKSFVRFVRYADDIVRLGPGHGNSPVYLFDQSALIENALFLRQVAERYRLPACYNIFDLRDNPGSRQLS